MKPRGESTGSLDIGFIRLLVEAPVYQPMTFPKKPIEARLKLASRRWGACRQIRTDPAEGFPIQIFQKM